MKVSTSRTIQRLGKRDDLGDAQAGAIGDAERGLVLDAGCRLQEAGDLTLPPRYRTSPR